MALAAEVVRAEGHLRRLESTWNKISETSIWHKKVESFQKWGKILNRLDTKYRKCIYVTLPNAQE